MSTINPEKRAACVLCVLQMSESMGQSCNTRFGPAQKLRAARWFIDQLIDDLIEMAVQGVLKPCSVDVGVIGYRDLPNQPLSLIPLLPNSMGGRVFVSLADLMNFEAPFRKDGPRRWVTCTAGGRANGAEVMRQVYNLLQQWLQRHPLAEPPLVIHCTDGQDEDGVSGIARVSLEVLATRGENVFLFTCMFHEGFAGRFRPGYGGSSLDPPWKDYWEKSSPLPGNHLDGAGGVQRALSINHWPKVEVLRCAQDLWVSQQESPFSEAIQESVAEGARFNVSPFWLAKRGNADSEWEDAFRFDESRGVAAVSDGAGEGIFVKAWATLLTDSFVQESPDLTTQASVRQWLTHCRKAWMAQINYPTLRLFQQIKVDRAGGASTFLGFMLLHEVSLAGEVDGFVWCAWAIGDSCLFWIRNNCLRASFPVIASSDFGRAPNLLRTDQSTPMPEVLMAKGRAQPGDYFVLATDAIACYLLHQCEEGNAPDWSRYWSLDQADWKNEIEQFRDSGHLVNDDCTILIIRACEGKV